MPTALVVSRYFPPLGSAGASIRLVKMIKYTAKLGWNFTVFTQDLKNPVIPEKELCGFLLSDIPAGTEIIRVPDPFAGMGSWQKKLKKVFKDSSLAWGKAVLGYAKKTIRQSKPDLIFVNSPPFTNVAVGFFLSSWGRIPLVIDLKDDWVGSSAFTAKRKPRQFLEKAFEKFVFSRATAIITPTETSCDSIKERYPTGRIKSKVFCIPNGEDLAEFRGIKQGEEKSREFLILSAAAGYRPDYRDLTPFIRALENFLTQFPQAKEIIHIEFLGEEPDEVYKESIGKLLPEQQVTYRGSLDRSQFVEALSRADLFFLVQPKLNFTAISGTLYEYWASGNAPVLLFSEKGASSQLVLENNFGRHFHFEQVEQVSLYVEQVFRAKQAGTQFKADQTNLKLFDRKANADKMAQIWTQAILSQRRA